MRLKRLTSLVILFMILSNLYRVNAIEKINSHDENVRVILNENDNEINHIEEKEELRIYSESAILIEEKTGKILYEKDCHARKYPASTTKILTAILAIENCDMNETAVASEYAVNSVKSGYTKANIQVGESFTIEQLLNVMMLQSANEAATIIAEHISGSEAAFAELMNKKAKEIGCLDSNFMNANGMHNDNHYSTAYDLALIARYCMQNEKFREVSVLKEASLPWTEHWGQEQVDEHGERIFKNTNKLMQSDSRYYYPYCIGIKSGFTTPAKNCLVSASNKDGFETISVILHAEATEDALSARYVDTINLFEYGYNNYNVDEILEEYDMIEYPQETTVKSKKNNSIIGFFSNYDENLNYNSKDDSYVNLVKIIIGVLIILLIIIFFIVKKIAKLKKDRMYDFKIN